MEGSSSGINRKSYPIRNRIKTGDAVNNIKNWLQDDEKDILYSESGSEEEFSENEEDEGEECRGVQLDVENTPTGENSPYNGDEVDDDILLDDLLAGG